MVAAWGVADSRAGHGLLLRYEWPYLAGVRVQDQLCIGQVLLQDEGVNGGEDDVVATVDDEGGLGDLLQVGVAVAGRLAPYAARGPVGPCGLGRPGGHRGRLVPGRGPATCARLSGLAGTGRTRSAAT